MRNTKGEEKAPILMVGEELEQGLESQARIYSNYNYTQNLGENQVFNAPPKYPRESLSAERKKDVFETEVINKQQLVDLGRRLTHTHLQDLRDSGLSDETILKSGIVSVSKEAAEEYLGYQAMSPCMVFPYLPLKGDDPYYRLKPEKPIYYGSGGKRKYLARKNGGNRLYLPPYDDVDAVLDDIEHDLIITEGEKKALKAYQEGYTAIALAGVWSWREKTGSGTGETKAIKELDCFMWAKRTVYIVFDSDAAENEDVKNAENALAKELYKKGARVLIARLPSLDDEEGKTGLDDYLLMEGFEDFDKRLREAIPPASRYFDGGTFKPLRLAKELSLRDRYIHAKDFESKGGKLYVYKKGIYRPAGRVDEKSQKLLGEETTSNRLKEAGKALNNMVVVNIKTLNPYKELINVENGLLNPFTGELEEHNPDFLSTIQIPTRWNPDARNKELEGFLDTICGRWKDAICELIGYLLLPKNFVKSFFVFPGETDTGKTTLLNLITGMIGERQCAEESLQTLCDPSRRFVHAHLEDKLLNVFDDMPAGYIGESSAIKVLTGGTPHIRIERKHENAYYARNFCRHIYACNELPKCADKSEAWYNRMQIFPFEHRLSEEEKEEGLRERFTEDKQLHEALLVKAVEGLKRLKEKKWKLEGSRKAKTEYKAKNDSVLAFISECCREGTGEKVKRTEFRKAYEMWCNRTGAYKLPTAKQVYDRVRSETYIDEKTIDGYEYFSGISLEEQ